MTQTAHPLRLVMPLGVGMIVSFASSYYLMGVMAGPMAEATGASSAELFTALSGAFLLAAFASMGAGRWIDRRGGREVLVAASLMLAGALAVMATATNALWAMAGVFALGLGMGVGFYAPANALLVAAYGMQAKKPITAVSLIGACGGAIGWPLTLFLIEALGWRGALWMWAGLHLMVCLPLYALLPKGRVQPQQDAAARVKDKVVWDRRMVQLAILFAGAWWVATACAAQLPRLLEGLGLDPAKAAMAASLMAVSAIGMRVLALIAPPKTSPVLTVRIAALLHPLGVGLALIGGRAASVCVAIGQGAGNGLLSVAAGVLPLHVFGTANYGQRQVAILLPARFVQAVAPMTFAMALDQSVGLALSLTCGVCLLMFGMTFGLASSAKIAARIPAVDRA